MSKETAAPASFGRYQVLEQLGSGAMGIVYLCVDPRLARPVAIKVLKESEFMTPAVAPAGVLREVRLIAAVGVHDEDLVVAFSE